MAYKSFDFTWIELCKCSLKKIGNEVEALKNVHKEQESNGVEWKGIFQDDD